MANLIRLKQIESGSALTTAAETGTNFSQSVINIITTEVEGLLPDGVVSSSLQIVIGDTIGQLSASRIIGDIAATSVNYEDIIGLPTLVSGSAQIIDILVPLNQHSASINTFTASMNQFVQFTNQFTASINQFTASLDNTYATDAELSISQSNINIDMGEW